ncbi:PEST proteolytic signal-containing nuclear protein-like isoform X2 [Phymastichus coffea]|uniref:PEST proteolytic signal-containing nuclear protein-like isoform X2 n=1 Tax=Phymastichus coffea TaxID=108790 RepID=UPI00273C4F84|nr:PEST proteolytic signal-containing nuclear protein-like isoform X2 [Phymastichus coffea]
MSNRNDYRRDDYKREDYRRDDYRRDDYKRDDYRKGSSSYLSEDRRREGEDSSSSRERSPHRPHDRYEYSGSSFQFQTDKQRLAFGFDQKPSSSDSKKGGIQMKLGTGPKLTKPVPPKKHTVASVFNNDDDDEPEEMPAEAKMRMRNIGRDTPTSAGPNSFGKTKQGFCDSKKIFEKTLKKAMEEASK